MPLLYALIAAIAAAAIGAAALPVGTALGLLDFPDEPGGRKRHGKVTPLVGGVTLTMVVIIAVIATIVAGADRSVAVDRDLARLALAVTAMFLIGAADDRFELSVRLRLLVATVVLLAAVQTVPDFAIAFLRFGRAPLLWLPGPWGVPFTLLCLVGLLNAVNMADGKNGIVIGLALIWSAFLLIHLPPTFAPLMAAGAAALAVLFAFNLQGRLFMGDGGSYAVSALFGLLAVYAYNHDFAHVGADDVALLFAVPVCDTLRLLAGRAIARRSPFAGGRDHLHHYLHAWIGWPRGLYVYLALAGLPNLAAALLPGTALGWLAATVIAYAVVLVVARRGA